MDDKMSGYQGLREINAAYLHPALELECNPYSGVTSDTAKRIAHDVTNYSYYVDRSPFDSMDVYNTIQPNWHFYNLPDLDEPCWFVTACGFEPLALRSTMVVVITISNGRAVYFGSANDEG